MVDIETEADSPPTRTSRRQRLGILQIAGGFWCAYAAYLLVYGWFQPPEFWLVTYGPPMTLFAYGAGLLHRDRYVLWLGWVIVLILLAGVALTGLIKSPFGLVPIALQLLLASYTTWVRGTLNRDDLRDIRFRFFYLAICAWIIEGDQSAREAALVSIQTAPPEDRDYMLGWLEGLPQALRYEAGGRLVSDVVDQFKQNLESAGRGVLIRLAARRRLRAIDREYADALKAQDASVFLRRHPDLAETLI